MASRSELYKFVENSNSWFYTSGATAEVYSGDTYLPLAGTSRTDTQVKNELSKANVDVTLPLSSELGMRHLRAIVEAFVGLTIYSKNEVGTVRVEWKGRLSGVRPDGAVIKLVFESIFTSLRRPGLRRRFQRTCPHSLYGRACGLDMEDWGALGDVTTVAGVTVVMANAAFFPDQYYRQGIIKASDGTLRFITNHVGNTLTLIRPLDQLSLDFATAPLATDATIYPGCNRLKETCKDTFDNILNNGSFPWLPTKNPVGGNSIV